MRVGDIVELVIESVGMEGEGVARIDGQVAFIPYALVGERVKCKVVNVNKKYINAQVIKVLEPSQNRVTPICNHYFKCGGCSMMHIGEREYDNVKVENLANCMRKIAKCDISIESLVKGDNSYSYRNKVQLPIGYIDNEVVVGYYKEKSHSLVAFDKCYLHGEWADIIIEKFLEYANINRISVYDERTGRGLLRHLVLRKIGDTVSIVVVINDYELPNYQQFIKTLDGIKFNLHININTRNTNVITSNNYKLLHGTDTVKSIINGVNIEISPASFMQINTDIASKIYNDVSRNLANVTNAVVIEGYSGIGILSNMLAKDCRGLISVEIVESAVQNAKKMAIANGNADKIIAICGDASELMPTISNAIMGSGMVNVDASNMVADADRDRINALVADNATVVAVLDPPRKGCDRAVLDAILCARPRYIYYISCNPATLARDIAVLKQDYVVSKVTPYDMFPWTASLETFVILTRSEE